MVHAARSSLTWCSYWIGLWRPVGQWGVCGCRPRDCRSRTCRAQGRKTIPSQGYPHRLRPCPLPWLLRVRTRLEALEMITFIDEYRDCFIVEFICVTLNKNREGGFLTSRGYLDGRGVPGQRARYESSTWSRLFARFTPKTTACMGLMWHALCRLGPSDLQKTEVLPLQALKQAIWNARSMCGLIHHRDHGS